MHWEEVDFAILEVVVVAAPHTVEGEECVDHPSLLEGVRVAYAQTYHHTPATTIAWLELDNLATLKEERASEVEGLHTSVGTHIETSCLALDVEAVLSLKDAASCVDVVAVAPLDGLVWREHRVDGDGRVRAYHKLELRIYHTHHSVEGIELGVDLRTRKCRYSHHCHSQYQYIYFILHP